MARFLSLANSSYRNGAGFVSDKLFQKKKSRHKKDLARKEAKRSPYETILIACEDSKSSPNYLSEIRKYFRLNTANVIVMPSKGSAPISVVEYSIEIAKTMPQIDRIACVFDRDNHESYERAINKRFINKTSFI